MIPVRVPMDVSLHTIGGVRTLDVNHPLYERECPVCDEQLADVPMTLVCVGIEPRKRNSGDWASGAAVGVHAACAGLEEDR